MAARKALRVSLVLGALAAVTALLRRAVSSRRGGARPDSEGIIGG